MRHTLLAASVATFSLPVIAQEAPRVLFCSGPCFSVDASGTRAPVAKGSPIPPGHRVETGPGAYLQVKMDRVGLGLGENTRLRFDQGALVLDQGRMRAVTGIGAGVVRPPQIRTPDGDLALATGDIEIKKTTAPGTLVKVNAGDATLRGAAGVVKLPTEGIQSLQGGRLALAPPTVGREMVLVPVRREAPAAGTPAAPVTTPPTIVRPVLTAGFVPVRAPVITPPPPPLPPLITRVMNTSLTDPTTGTTAKLTDFVRTTALTPPTTPTVTTLTTTPKVIAPIITTPTLRPRTGTTFVIR